jgi:branched-chain amino acid aminotransferase
MEPTVYINGELVALSQARVPVADYGFLFGYSIFETMRAYDAKIFKLDRHLDRLSRSAQALGLAVDRPEWEKAIDAVIKANKYKGARVRLIVSAGPGSLSPDLASCTQPDLIVLVAPYVPPAAVTYEQGYKMVISRIRRNTQSPLPGLKSANFLESLLARGEARHCGYDDALLLNDRGLLAEASSSNVFVLAEGELKTPQLGSGILPGVTRGCILEMAPALEIPVRECDISLEELLKAEEVFISNSMVEIMPVSRIDLQTIGEGKAGPVSLKLLEAYRAAVQGA